MTIKIRRKNNKKLKNGKSGACDRSPNSKTKKITFSYLETLLQQYKSNRIFFEEEEEPQDT